MASLSSSSSSYTDYLGVAFHTSSHPNPLNRFDGQDPFCWNDFDKKYSNFHFPSREVMEATVIPDVWRVCAWIDSGKPVEIHKLDGDDLVDYYLGESKLSWSFQEAGDKIVIKWSKFVSTYWDRMPKYKGRFYDPHPERSAARKTYFNLWPGFKARLLPREMVRMDLIRPWLDHLRVILSAGNIEFYRYMVSWLALICKQPWEKIGTAPMFCNEKQGTGRGIFFNFLIKHLFGEQISCNVSGIGALTGDWNTFQVGKVFIFVDELCSDKRKFHEMWDRLKFIITEDRFLVHTKYVNDMHTSSYLNFVGASQHKDSVKIEAGDRRYPIIENSDAMVGNLAYFKSLPVTQEAGDHLFSYLYHLDDSQLVDCKIIPKTDLRKQCLLRHRCKVLSFLDSIGSGEFKIKTVLKERVGMSGWAASQSLYEDYCQWSEDNKQTSITLTSFGLKMSTYCQGTEKACGVRKFSDNKHYNLYLAKESPDHREYLIKAPDDKTMVE